MSPGYVIVHGAGEGGFGRALGAFQQAREFENEARRREDEYQRNKKLAEAQLGFAQKQDARADQGAALDQRMGEAQIRFQDARASSFAQEFAQQAEQMDMEREVQKRRLAAIDKGVAEEEALSLFQSMEAAGIDLRQDAGMREGIRAAGQVLGGGLGSALSMIANATPQAREVFSRLPQEYRGRYLVDLAEETKREKIGLERERGLKLADTLVETGDITPEAAQQVTEALAGAEDEQSMRVALEQLYGAQRAAVTKGVNTRRKARLIGTLEKKLVQMQEVDGLEHVVERYESMIEELARDPDPDMQAWTERIAGATGSPVADPSAEFPMPRRVAGGGMGQEPTDVQPEAPMDAAAPDTQGVDPTEDEALSILEGAGFDPSAATSEEDVAEMNRYLAERVQQAQTAASDFLAKSGTGERPDFGAMAEELGVPRSWLGRLVKTQQQEGAELEADKKRARQAIRSLRDFDSTVPDAQVATELVRRKIAPNREAAMRVVSYLRSTGW